MLDWPFKYDLKKSNDSVKYDTPENIKPIDQWLRQGGRKSRWTVPLTKAKGSRGGRNSPSPNTGGYFGLVPRQSLTTPKNLIKIKKIVYGRFLESPPNLKFK